LGFEALRGAMVFLRGFGGPTVGVFAREPAQFCGTLAEVFGCHQLSPYLIG
jgi:hypothetical protein